MVEHIAALCWFRGSSSSSVWAAAAVDAFFSSVASGKCVEMKPEHCPSAWREVNFNKRESGDDKRADLFVAHDAFDVRELDAFAGDETVLHGESDLPPHKQTDTDGWVAQRVVCLGYGTVYRILLRNQAEGYLR